MVTFDPYWSPPPQHERAPLDAQQSRTRIFPTWVPGYREPLAAEAMRLQAGDLNDYPTWIRLGPETVGVLSDEGNFHVVDLATRRILGSADFLLGENEGLFDEAVLTPEGLLMVLVIGNGGDDSVLWFDPWVLGPPETPFSLDPLAEYLPGDYISRTTGWDNGTAVLLHEQSVLVWRPEQRRFEGPVGPVSIPLLPHCLPEWQEEDFEFVDGSEDGSHMHSVIRLIDAEPGEFIHLYCNAETGQIGCNQLSEIVGWLPGSHIGASANWMLLRGGGDIWAFDGLGLEPKRKLSLPAIFGIGTRTLRGTWKAKGRWIVCASTTNNPDFGDSIVAIWDMTKDAEPLVVPAQVKISNLYPDLDFIGDDWVRLRNSFSVASDQVELFDLESGHTLYLG